VNVLHVVPSLSIEDGGPTFALIALAQALSDAKVRVTILTTANKFGGQKDNPIPTSSAEVIYLKRNLRPYKVAWRIVPWLLANVKNFDVVHVHAVFSFASVAAALIAYWKRVPYIVRPLGVLNRWGMKNRRPVAKQVSYALIESKVLRNAGAIHFTSAREAEETYQLDVSLRSVPAIILPLPIEVPSRVESGHPFLKRFPRLNEVEWILFLSRFDRQKGLDLLLQAFAALAAEKPDALLVLAGGGEAAYVRSLRQRATALGIQDRIIWTGYLIGAEKWDALASATVFVLPSYSESFGIAAAEALASGAACILSNEVPFARDSAQAGAAVAVPCQVGPLHEAIDGLLDDPSQRKRLGQSGKQFANEHFSPAAVAFALTEEYRKLAAVRRVS
jgi:glycosyltransferase involved in cell wall biosynthesis